MAFTKKRGVARRFIPEMLGLGYSTTVIGWAFAMAGLTYRRTDMLADIREFSGRERKRDPLKAIPSKLRPTAATIQPSEYMQKSFLNYNYKITGYDTFTEQEVTEWITVSSDEILSMQEAGEIAVYLTDRYKEEVEVYKIEIDSVTSWREQA